MVLSQKVKERRLFSREGGLIISFLLPLGMWLSGSVMTQDGNTFMIISGTKRSASLYFPTAVLQIPGKAAGKLR